MNGHHGIVYHLFIPGVESSKWPSIIMFERGCVLLGAKRYDILASALEHVLEVVRQDVAEEEPKALFFGIAAEPLPEKERRPPAEEIDRLA